MRHEQNRLNTQRSTGTEQQRWLDRAEALKPALHEQITFPVGRVRIAASETGFQGWTVHPEDGAILPDRDLRNGDVLILDFGVHTVGYLNLAVQSDRKFQDAPVRLRLTFGEVPAEVATPPDGYRGQLCASWLQDEIITLDWLPSVIELPRRFAFQYVRIEVLAVSIPIRITSCTCRTVSSAGDLLPGEAAAAGSAGSDPLAAVSLRTLRNCMQTVFEDGPKRDRRLWVGDLRLQALANYASFQNMDLVKRCLYLFAALPHPDGLVSACVYEYPRAVCGEIRLLPYAALFNTVLFEYASHSGDWATARDLFPVAHRQIELLRTCFDERDVFIDPGGYWLFFDWAAVDPQAGMQALTILVLRQTLALAEKIGAGTADWEAWLERLISAARRHFVRDDGLVVSGPGNEISWASTAWMTIADVLTAAEARQALLALPKRDDAVRPVSPYLYHYVAEAMLHCGLETEAVALIRDYWGSMINLGATTFWEVYRPDDPFCSPYGDHRMNSYCHAWSCTPIWLYQQTRRTRSSE